MRGRTVSLCSIALLLFGLVGVARFSGPASAQGPTDLEPNNTCASAQDLGGITGQLVVSGSLTPFPDVDFFRFSGPAGVTVIVDLEGQATGRGTLGDPFLGFFNSSCTLVALNDDNGGNLNSHLQFTIPADGVFILGVTSCCDSQFLGGGTGTYQMTINPVFTARSISGRLVDSVTGDPLPGGIPLFSFVQLFRCSDGSCSNISFVNSQSPDSAGRFRFDRNFANSPLLEGTYRLFGFASQYQMGQTDVTVARDEDRDIGDFGLNSFPVRFSELRPCGSLPPEGGDCSYSVRVTNGMPTNLDGQVWSRVDSFGIGSFVNFTDFQPQNAQNLALGSGRGKVIDFSFKVPNTVQNGVFICSEVFVSAGRDSFFNTVGHRGLFCIQKGITGFSLTSEKETQEKFRRAVGSAKQSPKADR